MQLYHHLCNRWIIVREKQAFFFIQCPDSVHIACVQSKIKDIDIFFHTLLVGGFWDYHDIALQKETQSDLCCTPYFSIYSWAAVCCWKICVST